MITCSTKRRLKDGILTKNWLFIPSLSFAIVGLIIILFGYQPLYWLMLLSAALSSVLLTYPSKKNMHYIYGYSGPIDLKANNNSIQRNQRIEPTLTGQQVSQTNLDGRTVEQNDSYFSTHTPDKMPSQDIGELIREKLLTNRNSKLIFISLTIIIVFAMMVSLLLSHNNAVDTAVIEPKDEPISSLPLRENKITLPDDFSLMTTPFNGLIIHWQADEMNKQVLWDIRQALGEESCKTITFNNKDTFRTTVVEIEKSTEYFAEFSPLDTKNIIKSLAVRNTFTLCGYEFSLKGSQATLGKNAFYGTLLTQ